MAAIADCTSVIVGKLAVALVDESQSKISSRIIASTHQRVTSIFFKFHVHKKTRRSWKLPYLTLTQTSLSLMGGVFFSTTGLFWTQCCPLFLFLTLRIPLLPPSVGLEAGRKTVNTLICSQTIYSCRVNYLCMTAMDRNWIWVWDGDSH